MGVLRGTGTKIKNCHNKNTVVILKDGDGNRIIGGVLGQLSNGTDGIYSCSNNGTIVSNVSGESTFLDCGGVCGRGGVDVKIIDCKNFGNVETNGPGKRCARNSWRNW